MLALAIMSIATQAQADSLDSNFQANATLSASCRYNTVANINLSYVPTSDLLKKTAGTAWQITCSKTLPYTLSLNGGVSGNILDRTMTSATTTDSIHYNVYTDINFTNVFGDGTTGATISDVGYGSMHPSIVRFMLYTNQFVSPGNYSDTLTVTASY